MFIQTEGTPNPEALKFIPGCVVMVEGTASYHSLEECGNSHFAKKLLLIPGVESVFLGSDFISITKESEYDWFVLKPDILSVIMDQFLSNAPVILQQSTGESVSQTDDPLSRQIREIIDIRVRPAVAQDGGDVIFHSFQKGIVYLKMYGACSGCPSSVMTLKSGIENLLKYYIPEVVEVRSVE